MGQDRRSSREEALDKSILVFLSTFQSFNVVLEAGVQRIWTYYCSPQVLLKCQPEEILNEAGGSPCA